jgi:hypothetical protein
VAGGVVGGEAGDAPSVVGDDRGEREVLGQWRRRAWALRVVQRQVQPCAVQILETCTELIKVWLLTSLSAEWNTFADIRR